jgi:uncharacterized protein YjdB
MSRQKKVFALVVGILVAANALFVTCKQPTSSGGGKTVPVTGITLDLNYIELTEGQDEILKATIAPPNASEKRIKATVAPTSGVVSIDVDATRGIVTITAEAQGKATITVTTWNGLFPQECEVEVVKGDPVSDLKLNTDTLILYRGYNATLLATVEPPTAGNKGVTWKSNDENVATVVNGVVTAKAKGTATITATSRESADFKATCAITVEEIVPDVTVQVTGVTLNKTELAFKVDGSPETLTAVVAPSNASAEDKALKWFSTDKTVAEVSTNGSVTPKGVGSAVIIVTTVGNGKMAMCAVTVQGNEGSAYAIPVTGVTLNTDKLNFNLEGRTTATLIATVAPDNATHDTVNWSSSNRAIATVNSSGEVNARAAGSAIIIATTEDGRFTAVCAVTVQEPDASVPVTGFTLRKEETTIAKGGTETLEFEVTPGTATNKTIIWKSNKPSIAFVDTDGKITGVSGGYASITATTVSGGFNATCTVTVSVQVESVSISDGDKQLLLEEGETNVKLTATVLPTDATDQSLKWESSDETKVTVNDDGYVTAVAEGSATITVSSVSAPTKKATRAVKVEKPDPDAVPVSGVTLTPEKLFLDLGETGMLVAIVQPPDAARRDVTWGTDKPSVATVNGGVVTARAPGTATITVKTVQFGYAVDCIVTVRAIDEPNTPVTGITLDKPGLVLSSGASEVIKATVSPELATNKDIEWHSTDTSVVAVNPRSEPVSENEFEAVVTANGDGQALIYVTSQSSGKVTICIVTVLDNTGGPGAATGITLEPSGTIYAKIGDEVTLTARVNQEATNKAVTWESMDPEVAEIVESDYSSAKIIARAVGGTVITAKTHNGITTGRAVMVSEPEPTDVPVQRISVTPTERDMKPNQTLNLMVNYIPANTTSQYKKIYWESSDDTVAVVDKETGVVSTKAPGPVTITATSIDEETGNPRPNITATCKITVTQSAGFNIEFIDIKDEDLAIVGAYELSVSGSALTITFNEAANFDEVIWKVNIPGIKDEDGDTKFILDPADFIAYGYGKYFITLEVKKGTQWYSTKATLTLSE